MFDKIKKSKEKEENSLPEAEVQTSDTINCKKAPSIFLPLATTISLSVEIPFSITLEIKIKKYKLIFI